MKEKLSYKIDKIELVEFSIHQRPKLNNIDEIEFKFNIYITSQVVAEQNLIIQRVEIEMSYKETEVKLAEIILLIGYNITPFDKYVKLIPGKKVYEIDNNLDKIIRNISIGTSRGFLFSKLQGSYLASAVLPIILDDAFEKGKITTNID